MSPIGSFDYHSQLVFIEAYKDYLKNKEINQVEIDFTEVEYIDSSGLCMLLQLRKEVLALGIEVHLVKCGGIVQDIIDTANFGQIFKISMNRG